MKDPDNGFHLAVFTFIHKCVPHRFDWKLVVAESMPGVAFSHLQVASVTQVIVFAHSAFVSAANDWSLKALVTLNTMVYRLPLLNWERPDAFSAMLEEHLPALAISCFWKGEL